MAQEGRNTFASKVKGEISRNKGLIARNKKAFTYGMLLCGKSFSEQRMASAHVLLSGWLSFPMISQWK